MLLMRSNGQRSRSLRPFRWIDPLVLAPGGAWLIRENTRSLILPDSILYRPRKSSIWLTLNLPSDKFALPTISSEFPPVVMLRALRGAFYAMALRLGLLLSPSAPAKFT